MAAHTVDSFSSNPITLLNEIATFLQEKHGPKALHTKADTQGYDEPTTLLSQFARYLSNANSKNRQGILTAFVTALEISNLHDLWVVDSGATDHMSNKIANIRDFSPYSVPVFVSVANGKMLLLRVKGKLTFSQIL